MDPFTLRLTAVVRVASMGLLIMGAILLAERGQRRWAALLMLETVLIAWAWRGC